MINKFSTVAILFMINSLVLLGQNSSPAMADVMRSNGKIYVVVAIVLAVFLGIIIYLLRLEKKVKKIEQFQQNEFNSKR